MRKIYYLLLVLLVVGCGKDQTPREGDIIFQTSVRPEAALIHEATQSPISHCGIIIEKEEGNFYVLDVADHVRLIPLNKFIASGYEHKYAIKRADLEKEVKIDYQNYLGCKRDIFLRMGDNKFYSSELVYTIYKEQFGIELYIPKAVHSYNIENAKGYLQSHHINPNQPVIAPADLYNSEQLKSVRDTYEKVES